MDDTSYKELGFGYKFQETFSSSAAAHLDELKEKKEFLKSNGFPNNTIESVEQKIRNLEAELENEASLYDFIRTVFDELVRLEKEGKSHNQIIETVYDDEPLRSRILRISTLIERGQRWGYHFIQDFLAYTLDTAWDTPSKSK